MTNDVVLWFKRDLRVHDHAALSAAARAGPLRCLWVLEPSLWCAPDASVRQLGFALESAQALSEALARRGVVLQVCLGEMPALLERLYQQRPFAELHSHEETGNALSYARDRRVARWCAARGVRWQEHAQFAVVRRLASRDLWAAHRAAWLSAPPTRAPEALTAAAPLPLPPAPHLVAGALSDWCRALGMAGDDAAARQRGGRPAARAWLSGFLTERAAGYRTGLSSPLTAESTCSRLSPYLAWGCLSLREVVYATERRLRRLPPHAAVQRRGLNAFAQRLAWHCHFIQKLETEPELEWRNLHPGYDGLREHEHRDDHLQALMSGRTGWPLVDACVAMLRETGWLNFRMRAMLVSVAAYPLWLHWRPVGLWLAQQFVDYEPGIHWSQLQMQSGTTGINTTRVYNPIKQAQDQDPQGHFVRRWLPAMRRVPDAWLWEPWRMPEGVQQRCGVRVGVDLPVPLVDLERAVRLAKQRLHARRAQPSVKALEPVLVQRHAARWRRDEHTGRLVPASESDPRSLQPDLF